MQCTNKIVSESTDDGLTVRQKEKKIMFSFIGSFAYLGLESTKTFRYLRYLQYVENCLELACGLYMLNCFWECINPHMPWQVYYLFDPAICRNPHQLLEV